MESSNLFSEAEELIMLFESTYSRKDAQPLKKSVDDLFKTNDIIFDIDWQGSQQLSKFKNLKLVKIFLIPPNKEELRKKRR